MKSRLFFLLLAADMGVASAAFSQSSAEDALARQEASCEARLSYLRTRIDRTVLWSNIFMIAGATTAALGAGLAGFLGTKGQRQSAAVIGAIGAVITVLPKALPDKNELQTTLAAADRHHTVGAKFHRQFFLSDASEDLSDARKYVSARFTDCEAMNPPENIPDLPSPDPGRADREKATRLYALAEQEDKERTWNPSPGTRAKGEEGSMGKPGPAPPIRPHATRDAGQDGASLVPLGPVSDGSVASTTH